jgi:hypothetical protein
MGAKITVAESPGCQLASSPRLPCDPGRHVVVATGICSIAHSIFGSTVCNLAHVALLAFGIARWFIEFWKICGPLSSLN